MYIITYVHLLNHLLDFPRVKSSSLPVQLASRVYPIGTNKAKEEFSDRSAVRLHTHTHTYTIYIFSLAGQLDQVRSMAKERSRGREARGYKDRSSWTGEAKVIRERPGERSERARFPTVSE